MTYIPSSLGAANFDAFQRLRASNPITLFDCQLQYNLQPLLFQTYTTGGGGSTCTHLPNESAAQLAVAAVADSRVLRQTWRYFRYQPGKSQLIFMTTVLGAGATGVTKRVGYYDDDNGIFLERNGATAVNFVRRSKSITGSVVDTAVAQASWNIDKFDGTGPSGITLDFTKAQILVIDLQWLGVGAVRCGFSVDGKIYYAQQFNHANALTTTYTTTMNLPFRYELLSNGANASNDFKQICCSLISEGGFETDRGYVFNAYVPAASPITVGVSRTTLVAIRPKDTFNSIVNRGFIQPITVDLINQTKDILWEVLHFPQGTGFTGGSWSSADANSLVEYSTVGTIGVPAQIIDSGYLAAGGGSAREITSANLASNLILGRNYVAAGSPAQDVVALVATAFSASASVNGSIGWKEIY